MSEQILSQEEIDALLSGMDKGDVDLEKDNKEKAGAELYDLTSRSMMASEQLYALEKVYDKFISLLHTALSSSFQRPIEVEFVSSKMIKFGECIESFPNRTNYNIFNMEPLTGASLLAIEPALVFSLIDCMFGGDGKPVVQDRDFTLIEERMIRKFSILLLKNLEKAWETIDSLNIVYKKSESKPEFIQIVAPNELVIITTFSISGEEFSGNVGICISYLMLEPIKDKLSSKYMIESELENTWSPLIKELMNDMQVRLTAELGKTTKHTVGDLLNLHIGDLVKLNTGPQDTVSVMVEQVPKYMGFSGVIKGNKAVQVVEFVRNDGG